MDSVYRRDRENPSFSSTLLDAIYRSIDKRDDDDLAVCRETVRSRQSNGCSEDDHDEQRYIASLRRACLIEKWMEKKVTDKVVVGRKSAADVERSSRRSEGDSLYFNSSSSSSDSSCGGGFSSSEAESIYGVLSRPKPIRTSIHQHEEYNIPEKNRNRYGQKYHLEDSQPKAKNEGKFVKTKSRALKIYGDLKKVKQPISPGGRLATFLNSLFTSGNTKKAKISSSSSGGGYDEPARSQFDRKSKSANASACSSASSFSRSCLSKTPSSRGKLSNGMKRSVRFYPVSVIVNEDCQPCGHKSLYGEKPDLETVKFANNSVNDKLKVRLSEKNRHVEEVTKNLLKNYHKKLESEFDLIGNNANEIDMNDEDEDDAESYASSDLFELDNLSAIGIERYREELPVYGTTNFEINNSIARNFIV